MYIPKWIRHANPSDPNWATLTTSLERMGASKPWKGGLVVPVLGQPGSAAARGGPKPGIHAGAAGEEGWRGQGRERPAPTTVQLLPSGRPSLVLALGH